MYPEDDMQGCPNCGWKCAGCGNYNPDVLEREALWEEMDRQIEEEANVDS